MDAPSFLAALLRCGIIDLDTRVQFITQGYTNMVEFSGLNDDDISDCCKYIVKLPGHPPPGGGGFGAAMIPYVIPFATIRRLKAMRLWVKWQIRMGRPIVHDEFTPVVLAEMEARWIYEKELPTEVDEPKTPVKLKDVTQWREFWEAFDGTCMAERGVMKIPLSYIYRTHTEVTDEIRAAAYDDSDQRYMATVVLRGPDYKIDNGRVWDKLRPLVNEGTCWSFVKNYKDTKNGRGAIDALRHLAMGDAPTLSRKDVAYRMMDRAFWNGQSRNSTHDKLVSDLQFAYTELEALGEPVAESRKVNTYTNAIEVKELDGAMAMIMSETGPNGKANNFAAAHQYVQRMILSQRDGIPSEREVDTAREIKEVDEQLDDEHHDDDEDKEESGKRGLDLDTYYSDEYLDKYTKEERDEFFQAKRDRKAKKAKLAQEEQQRQTAAVIQQLIGYVSGQNGVAQKDVSEVTTGNGNEVGNGQVQAPANPTSQFGRHSRGNANATGNGRR